MFGPMKRKWREVLSDWKDECERSGTNYATLIKQEFPALLNKLLQKDYSQSIRSGFEACGLFPLSVERALAKLPREDRGELPPIHKQLVQQLSSMRYDPQPTTQAKRPKKKEKLPAGAAYTCAAGGDNEEGDVTMPIDLEEEMQEEEMQEEVLVTSDDDEADTRQRRSKVHNIIKRLGRRLEDENDTGTSSDSDSASDSAGAGDGASSSEEEEEERVDSPDKVVRKSKRGRREAGSEDEQESVRVNPTKLVRRRRGEDGPDKVYEVGTYVAAIYQGAWYIGQVLDKKLEARALPSEEYLYLNFMQRVMKDSDNFKWPEKSDKLNTLREDILFVCSAPVPSNVTSSSRSITYSLPIDELKKANMLLNKAYYNTFFNFYFFTFLLFYFFTYIKGNVSKDWTCFCTVPVQYRRYLGRYGTGVC